MFCSHLRFSTWVCHAAAEEPVGNPVAGRGPRPVARVVDRAAYAVGLRRARHHDDDGGRRLPRQIRLPHDGRLSRQVSQNAR